MNAINKQQRKPSEAKPTDLQMVAFCVAAFADYMVADTNLQNAKALWDAARMGLRTELARAKRVIASGAPWDRFLAQVRAGLVKAKVSGTPKEAGRLIRNQLIALNLTGEGAKKGGKPGRKEKTATGTAEKLSEKDVAARLVRVLAFVAESQATHAGDDEMLEVLGTIARLANGDK